MNHHQKLHQQTIALKVLISLTNTFKIWRFCRHIDDQKGIKGNPHN